MSKCAYDSTVIFRLYKDDEDFLRQVADKMGLSLGSFLRKLVASYRRSYGKQENRK